MDVAHGILAWLNHQLPCSQGKPLLLSTFYCKNTSTTPLVMAPPIPPNQHCQPTHRAFLKPITHALKSVLKLIFPNPITQSGTRFRGFLLFHWQDSRGGLIERGLLENTRSQGRDGRVERGHLGTLREEMEREKEDLVVLLGRTEQGKTEKGKESTQINDTKGDFCPIITLCYHVTIT